MLNRVIFILPVMQYIMIGRYWTKKAIYMYLSMQYIQYNTHSAAIRVAYNVKPIRT